MNKNKQSQDVRGEQMILSDAVCFFIKAAYFNSDGTMPSGAAELSHYYAVQVDVQTGLGFHTAQYLPGYKLEDAQNEAKKNSRKKRAWRVRVVRIDTVTTIIEPLKKAKKGGKL